MRGNTVAYRSFHEKNNIVGCALVEMKIEDFKLPLS